MNACSNCGTSNSPDATFCEECGAKLTVACATCGAPLGATAKFCRKCGTPVAAGSSSAAAVVRPLAAGGSAAAAVPVSERRLVSVMFADLVGFTALAEGRDPEETRELLSRYFDLARETVERYAGVVEKFIGDAVMAVWGAPTAREDDAERAVRAAMDLVAAVRSLGPSLQARAGVLTGEAAVTIGAVGQGMVAGDLVNTASRLQSAAAPGTVLVGEATQRAAASAIAFEPAGEQSLKGKTVPVPAFRALRVVAERGGRGRSEALEAPFVGRDDELRLLKDLFHATSREGRARLVSVIGPAGIGKTRLAWEFLKYVDGVFEEVWWHEGRSPAYGEGISFWALGEMVRGRCGLVETADESTTRAKVADTVREHVPDEAERRWIEAALLALLGFGDGKVSSAELFGAWRTFFERMSDTGIVTLVFEDFNNADAGLIDFVDSLLEWSRGKPIYVLTLARPELLDRRPDWHAKRNFASITLEPLSARAMHELMAGLVPGLPEAAVRSIVARADGMPLYAVETVRMLLAGGRLELRDGVYRPVGDLAEFAVPETLAALISSRIDSLDPADRALVHDAAVLGQSFIAAGLAAVSGISAADLEPRLRTLVRREILAQSADPRSPERGSYSFVQALVREVAYSTLSHVDRKARHIAAARYFESLGTDELAGAVAGHYLAAHRNASDGAEAEQLAAKACDALCGASDRARSLGSYEQAATFAEQALTVTTDPAERASLLEQAGDAWVKIARYEVSIARLNEAIALNRERGDRRGTARVIALLVRCLAWSFRAAEAKALAEPALVEFADLADESEGVDLLVALARTFLNGEDNASAIASADAALPRAERLELDSLIGQALMIRGTSLLVLGRSREGLAVLRGGIEVAEADGAVYDALTGRIGLQIAIGSRDPAAGIVAGRTGLAEAKRLGLRSQAIAFAGNMADDARWTGDWDWLRAEIGSLLDGNLEDVSREWLLSGSVVLRAWSGEDVSESLSELDHIWADGKDAGMHRVMRLGMEACVNLAAGRLAEAHARASEEARISPLNAPDALQIAGRAATWMRNGAMIAEDLAALDATDVKGPVVILRRFALLAAMAALEGRTDEARSLYRRAFGGLVDKGIAFEAALVAIDMATVLEPGDPDGRAAAAEVRPVLERLQARPFIERLERELART